jgi:hypothetical protein
MSFDVLPVRPERMALAIEAAPKAPVVLGFVKAGTA